MVLVGQVEEGGDEADLMIRIFWSSECLLASVMSACVRKADSSIAVWERIYLCMSDGSTLIGLCHLAVTYELPRGDTEHNHPSGCS